MTARSRGRGARTDDRGAAAVEFALLLPIFVILCIGMITFGFALERYINVTQAARESSRFAATYPFASGSAADVDAWFAAVSTATAENAGIRLSGADATPVGDYFICIRFVNETGPATPGTTLRTYGSLGAASATCTGSSLPDNRVEVRVERAAALSWVVGDADIAVTGENTSRFEPRIGA